MNANAQDPSGAALRILVYGVTGSGKTTLARRISERTGLPWHSVDDLTWEPGWVQVPLDEQRRRIQAICDGPEWVLDTAYSQWREIPMACTELIVALDYPRWMSLSRLVWRCLLRLVDGRTICNGNRESLKLLFSKDSIVAWHFQSYKHKRDRIATWRQQQGGPKIVRIQSQKQLEHSLNTLSRIH